MDDREREAVREAVILDPDADAEVREIERDLLDAAAAGTLDPARQALVEERLMQDPRNRGAVALAQALAEHHAHSSTGPAHDTRFAAADFGADPAHGAPAARASRTPASVWHPSMLWAAAAALIAALALGPLMLRTSRDTHETSRTPTAVGKAPITPPVSVDPAVNPPLPPPSDSARAGAPAKGAPDLPRDPSRLVALVLPAGTLRGARPSVTLPREAETLRLEIELDDAPQPTPGEVTVMLRALIPGSSSVSASEWRWTSRVRVRVDNDQPIAVALVPARSIPTGPMEATITWPRGASPRVIPFLVRRN